jgi:hypothetical protein
MGSSVIGGLLLKIGSRHCGAAEGSIEMLMPDPRLDYLRENRRFIEIVRKHRK